MVSLVRQRKIQGSRVLGLDAGETGGVSADPALAAGQEQGGEHESCQFQGTVMKFTYEQNVHGMDPYVHRRSVCIVARAH